MAEFRPMFTLSAYAARMRSRSLTILLCALALASCSKESEGRRQSVGDGVNVPPGGNSGGDNDASTPTTAGGNTSGDTAGSGGGGATAGSGAGGADGGMVTSGGNPPGGSPLRFVVLGDGGTGDDAQIKVAAAVKKVCATRGCSFALYLGDNIYEDGANGVTDAQFKAKFEDPYAELDFPFYVVLGNHDYGSNGSNILPVDAKSATQVEYTARSEKWNMPHYFYTFQEGPVAFFALDTNGIVIDRFRNAEMQQTWLEAELKKSTAPWKIVFGHHPYISNGEHGNAGSYVGSLGFELHSGSTLKSLVEESVCGKAQVYFSGHDHDREWLKPTCGTSFIVSGAAAKLRALEDRGSATLFGDATKHGFMWVEVQGDVLTGVFYDEDAKESYQDMIVRK